MPDNVDYSKFLFKTKAVKRQFALAAAQVMLVSAQEVLDKTIKNLSGRHVYEFASKKDQRRYKQETARLPVHVVTGTLRRSVKMFPLSSVDYAIFADQRVAPYAKFVHDGTKRMKKRPFLRDVIQERRQAIINRIRYELLKAIRAEGQK